MVTINAHPKTGELFTATKNPEWVKCQLSSEEMTVNNGVIQVQKRVAFPLVSAKVVPLLKGLKSGSVFPIKGKITRKVTSTPQFAGHTEVVNPSTGEAMGYYQSYTFTTDMTASDVDERIAIATPAQATNVEEAALAELNG